MKVNKEEIEQRIDFLSKQIDLHRGQVEKLLLIIENSCKEIIQLQEKINSNE